MKRGLDGLWKALERIVPLKKCRYVRPQYAMPKDDDLPESEEAKLERVLELELESEMEKLEAQVKAERPRKRKAKAQEGVGQG